MAKRMIEEDLRQMLQEQAERNKALLDLIRSKGASVDQKRFIEHHFWAKGAREAALLAKRLYDQGFLVLAISRVTSDDSGLWNVEAGIDQTPIQAASLKVIEGLIRTATQFDSVYDGWGTSI